jgi:hypothetical protein
MLTWIRSLSPLATMGRPNTSRLRQAASESLELLAGLRKEKESERNVLIR